MKKHAFTLLAALVMTAAAAVHFDGAKYALFGLTVAAAVLYTKQQKDAAAPAAKKQEPPRRWSVCTVLDPATSAPRYILHSGLNSIKLDRAALVAWLNDHPKDAITGRPQDVAMIERIRRM